MDRRSGSDLGPLEDSPVSRDYPAGELGSSVPILELPLDYPKRSTPSGVTNHVPFLLDPIVSAEVSRAAARSGMSLLAFLCGSWSLLMAYLSRQTEVIVGIPVECVQNFEKDKIRREDNGLMPIHISVLGDWKLSEFLKHLSSAFYNVEPKQKARESHPHIGSEFQTVVSPKRAHDPTFRHPDIWFEFDEQRGFLCGRLYFATDLFLETTAERWSGYLADVVQKMADIRVDSSLRDIVVVPDSEQMELLDRFNETASEYPENGTVHKLFEQVAREMPDAIAIIETDNFLTYEALSSQANRLSAFLRSQRLVAGMNVAVVMTRCSLLAVVQLAILKCGAVYVPIDPTFPLDRQKLIVEDCGTRLILYRSKLHGELRNPGIRVVDVEGLREYDAPSRIAEVLEDFHCPTAPAYVMYTSGSTGKPKGVVVPHVAILRLVINSHYADLGPSDRVAFCNNPAFDASTFELWGALLNGAGVVFIPQTTLLDATELGATLVRHGVTAMILTTALFNQHAAVSPRIFAGLRYLLFGGESADARTVRRVLEHGCVLHLSNVYGPTETTTFATWYPAENLAAEATTVPIGRPIANTTIYVLDEFLRPVPKGVSGEIYIGGVGVALGYLNRPDLTCQRFIADPFTETPGVRLYRSGDMGRWLEGGLVEYKERHDRQVKIRGFRIELGEIEAQILAGAEVKEAVVLAREDVSGDKRLVAYVTLNNSADDLARAATERIRSRLRLALPDYMIPAAFVVQERLPLTGNGKINRKALPAPSASAYFVGEFVPPQGETELQLARIWEELLGFVGIGRNDNFFRFGGNSIQVMKLAAKVSERLGARLPPTRVYSAPVLHEMARLISALLEQGTERYLGDNGVEEGVL